MFQFHGLGKSTPARAAHWRGPSGRDGRKSAIDFARAKSMVRSFQPAI
jgi:hypothetical protein